MIRLGLIGCGAWGWRYMPSADEAANARVTHVCGVSRAPDAARAHLGSRTVLRSYREMLAAPIDAVVVATPPSERVEVCRSFLARGVPVLVEKPLALSLAEARSISQAATEAAVPLLVAHQHLFAPAYEAIRDATRESTALWIEAEAGGPGPERTYSALWDYGPHDVAMLLGLMPGRPEVTSARRRAVGAVDFSLRAGNGYGYVQISNALAAKRRRLVLSDGRREFDYDDTRSAFEKLRVGRRLWPTHQGARFADISHEKPLTRTVRAFANAVKTGRGDWRFAPEFAVDVVRVIETVDAALNAT